MNSMMNLNWLPMWIPKEPYGEITRKDGSAMIQKHDRFVLHTSYPEKRSGKDVQPLSVTMDANSVIWL